MAREKSMNYYLRQVPHTTEEFVEGSLDDVITNYKKWKLETVAYYENDEKLEKEFPIMYMKLTDKEITEEEIETIKEEYKKIIIVYSNKLTSAEYDLE
ncbi:MAG: hypothetical protein LBU84_07340 [Prevotella sp.]|jgi:hypothetical protein|nr:hypothetical protein [Prevotella sp.]